MIIAVDADGGDYAPREIVKGAVEAAQEYGVDIVLLGRKNILNMLVRRYSKMQGITTKGTSQTIDSSEQPVQAIRSKTDSSIVVGIKMVKDGTASAFVSAGNTGAVLSAAFLNLERIHGVQRPALCSIIHINVANPVLLIDVGANVDCLPSYLVQFAQLGVSLAKGFLVKKSPKVGLVNNGEEEIKGNRLTRESYRLLNESNLNFIGNVEGQDILTGKADVIVTDGFTGNVLLKTIEGFSDVFQSFVSKGQLLEVDTQLYGSALAHYIDSISMVRRMDYKEYGGAFLLGINGNVVVAHGRSQSKAIKNAIYMAYRSVNMGLVEAIKNDFNILNRHSIRTTK